MSGRNKECIKKLVLFDAGDLGVLGELAVREDRSVSYLIREAVREYIRSRGGTSNPLSDKSLEDWNGS